MCCTFRIADGTYDCSIVVDSSGHRRLRAGKIQRLIASVAKSFEAMNRTAGITIPTDDAVPFIDSGRVGTIDPIRLGVLIAVNVDPFNMNPSAVLDPEGT